MSVKLGEGDSFVGVLEPGMDGARFVVREGTVTAFIRENDPLIRQAQTGDRWTVLLGRPRRGGAMCFSGQLVNRLLDSVDAAKSNLQRMQVFRATFYKIDGMLRARRDGVEIRTSHHWMGPPPPAGVEIEVRYFTSGGGNVVYVVEPDPE